MIPPPSPTSSVATAVHPYLSREGTPSTPPSNTSFIPQHTPSQRELSNSLRFVKVIFTLATLFTLFSLFVVSMTFLTPILGSMGASLLSTLLVAPLGFFVVLLSDSNVLAIAIGIILSASLLRITSLLLQALLSSHIVSSCYTFALSSPVTTLFFFPLFLTIMSLLIVAIALPFIAAVITYSIHYL